MIIFIALSLAAGLSGFITCCSDSESPGKDGLVKMTIIVPRSLEVLDDYHLNVAWAMGYFEEEGLVVHAEGALGTTDSPKLVAEGAGEVANPAPPVL